MRPTLLFMPYPSSSGTWGSTVKLAVIASECRSRGARTIFHACPPTADMLRERGFPVLAFSGAPPRDLRQPVDSFYDACRALGFDDRAYLDRLLREEERVIAQVQPDLIVSDMRPTAAITAARSQIPLVACAAWSTDPRAQATGVHPYDRLAAELAGDWAGLHVRSFAELISARADLQLATSFPAFEPELDGTPGLVYVGYLRDTWHEARPWREAVPRRLVIAYASSAPWAVPKVLAALDEAAGRAGAVVWYVQRAGGLPGHRFDHCRVFSFLPFGALMQQAAAVIFHGGQGTALGSIYHGVPSLAVPGRHYERRYNAQRLAQLGVGRHGDLVDLRPSRLASSLSELLDDDRIQRALCCARAAGARYPGAALAADAIFGLLGQGLPGR